MKKIPTPGTAESDEFRPFVTLPKSKLYPIIEFYHYSGHVREWCCVIETPNGDHHAGDGTTQCEALLLASVHWGMHGK